MHELTLATAIVEMAVLEAEKNNAGSVKEIELEVGKLSGVDADALEFALSLAVRNTKLEYTVIKILHTDGIGRCNLCNRSFIMHAVWTPCPGCKMPAGQIIHGEALRVVSLVVDD